MTFEDILRKIIREEVAVLVDGGGAPEADARDGVARGAGRVAALPETASQVGTLEKAPLRRGRKPKERIPPDSALVEGLADGLNEAELPEAVKPLTYNELAVFILAYMNVRDRAATEAVLAEFGVRTAKELLPQQYAEVKSAFAEDLRIWEKAQAAEARKQV